MKILLIFPMSNDNKNGRVIKVTIDL